MRTRWMMTASAAMMTACGLAATFLPQEIAAHFGGEPHGPAVLLLQATGGLYLGFAMVNWFSRATILGGIYNRPLVIGNLLHFTVVALALAKQAAGGHVEPGLLAITLLYALFALWFGIVMMSSPTREVAS